MFTESLGNRHLTSLGNVEASKLASLTFVAWSTGDVLYLTGAAQNLVGQDARNVMPFQDCVTEIKVTGYIFVKDALPVRQAPGSQAQASPYSPPIRFLASEKPPPTLSGSNSKAKLKRIVIHSDTIATFTWEVAAPLAIQAGQAAILDFSSLLGERQYQHMNFSNPSAVNDDRIRTWTVSSYSSTPSTTFSLTMRVKEGGLVTGALFNIATKISAMRKELLDDATPMNLEVGLVGVGGDFQIPSIEQVGTLKLLWIAGGIGLTPFLAMLKGLSASQNTANVRLIFTTREPEVLVPLISQSLSTPGIEAKLTVKLDVFAAAPFETGVGAMPEWVQLTTHHGRYDARSLHEADVDGREIYLCGPSSLEKDVLEAVRALGVAEERVHQEGFAY